MEIIILAIPAGVLTLLAFFIPIAVAVINHPRWPAGSKRIAAIVVNIALTALALAIYYLITGDIVLYCPVMLLLAFVVQQAAYALIMKSPSKSVEGHYGAH